MANPFQIDGPALVSFSGGRTSAYMLWRILQAHGGTLPNDVRVTFANTGKEMPQTLDFVRDCGESWGADIVWLQYKDAEETRDRWERVTYETAARKGEPFDALINRRKYLPNSVQRFCTSDLKIIPMKRYAQSLGWGEWLNVIGLRADEQHRVAKMRGNDKDEWQSVAPLSAAGVTRAQVQEFWNRQNFNLALPSVNGRTALGNCDLCFMKGAATRAGIIRQHPELAKWWIDAEARINARFSSDAPSYNALRDHASVDLFDAPKADCFCMEDAA